MKLLVGLLKIGFWLVILYAVLFTDWQIKGGLLVYLILYPIFYSIEKLTS